jgi:hypothetical protein
MKGKDHSEGLGIDGKIKLNGSNYSNESSCSIKGKEFLD